MLRRRNCSRRQSSSIGTKQNSMTVNVTVKSNLRVGKFMVFKRLEAKFGAPIEGIGAMDFAEPDSFFRMGTPPVMVDIMPKISGVEFEEAWRRRVDVRIDLSPTIASRSTGCPRRFRATCPAPVPLRLPYRWPRVSGASSETPPLLSCAALDGSFLHVS